MASPILDSHMPTSSNTILNSHGWPNNTSGNALLVSHGDPYVAGSDTYPDAFYFADIAGTVALSTNTQSVETITVAGITPAVPVAITISGSGGSLHQYSKNGTGYTSAAGTVVAGDTVRIQHTSSASNSTPATTTLTIGGRSDTFTSTTVAASGFSAVLNTGTGELVITGTGFGAKPTPAPVYFQSFAGLSNGLAATHASVGLDWGNDGYGYPQTTNTDGIGGGSLRVPVLGITNAPDTDWFFHMGLELPSNQQVLFVNQWHKFHLTAGTALTQQLQLKSFRAGRLNAADPTAEGSYPHPPAMAGSLWIETDGSQDPDGLNTFRWYKDSTDPTENYNFEPEHDPDQAPYDVPNAGRAPGPYPIAATAFDQWFNLELYGKMNDYGSANGEQIFRINNQESVHISHINMITVNAPEHAFQYVNLCPGLDYVGGVDFDFLTSRIYVDSTQMRVMLGNASTYAACTGAFLLPPTEWADTLIKCSNCTNIPAGYDWVYVMDAANTEIDSGPRT